MSDGSQAIAWNSSSRQGQYPSLTCVGAAHSCTTRSPTCTRWKVKITRPLRTLSLVSIWALFLWTILMIPGGWTQASPSTCTGTPSSPNIVIFTVRHWNKANMLFENTDRPESLCDDRVTETWQKVSILRKHIRAAVVWDSFLLCSETQEVEWAVMWETNLCYPVMLQFDDPWYCHLHTVKYCNHFQDLVIKWWRSKYLKGKIDCAHFHPRFR